MRMGMLRIFTLQGCYENSLAYVKHSQEGLPLVSAVTVVITVPIIIIITIQRAAAVCSVLCWGTGDSQMNRI